MLALRPYCVSGHCIVFILCGFLIAKTKSPPGEYFISIDTESSGESVQLFILTSSFEEWYYTDNQVDQQSCFSQVN